MQWLSARLVNSGIHSAADARRLAEKRLPWMVFDYIDGAAGSGYGEALNRRTLQQMQLQPRILNNVEQRSIGVKVFGQESKLPFGVTPMGMCNLAGPGADQMLARLGVKYNIPIGVSTMASTSLEKYAEQTEGRAWFQLYFGGDPQHSYRLIDRCKAAGYKTFIVGVDVPEVGRRPRELRRGFKMPFRLGPYQFVDFALHPYWSLSSVFYGKPELANFGGEHGEFDRTASRAGADWKLLETIRDKWDGNLVVKGVSSVEDSLRLKSMGIDAIQVSSHGGRQLESTPPAILCLAAIRDAVGPEYPLFYDSGIRSGEDIVKAYACGANFVFLGRPFSFAIAGKGEKGLGELTEVLAAETSLTLAQLGLTDMQSVNRSCLANFSLPVSS